MPQRDENDDSWRWTNWTRAWTHSGMAIFALGAAVSIVSPFGIHPVDFAIAALVCYAFELHRRSKHIEFVNEKYGSVERLAERVLDKQAELATLYKRHGRL